MNGKNPVEVFADDAIRQAFDWLNRAEWHKTRGEDRLAAQLEAAGRSLKKYAEIAFEDQKAV